MGNYSQGINLHRAWEENRLLGEAELLGCSPDGDVNPVSARVDTVDSPKIASKNLVNTKWDDIVTKGPASSRTLPSWAETIDKFNSTQAESHHLLNIPLVNEEEQSENSDCSLPCSTNEASEVCKLDKLSLALKFVDLFEFLQWKKASLGFLTAVLLAKVDFGMKELTVLGLTFIGHDSWLSGCRYADRDCTRMVLCVVAVSSMVLCGGIRFKRGSDLYFGKDQRPWRW
ncbi:hypothetical protein V6N12_048997 [Hibiscus sabdariffa]|uniref:Uncharacterized protein n=1 Tax=Hibiscus sabdariffa TaxID=183260 RepID=A0ABR2EIW0_9ROSI